MDKMELIVDQVILDYVAELPNEAAKQLTIQLLAAAMPVLGSPSAIVASGDGGVAMLWRRAGRRAEAECDNDGEIWATFGAEAFKCDSAADAVEVIRRFLHIRTR